MTRIHSAATASRALRGLLSIGAVLVLAVLASGCVGGQAPAPTPDPFAGLADRSDQAFREGLEAYGQGQYRDALTAFERARILSPSGDAHIDQMIERSRAALAPTPTPVPPTPTSVPVAPTPTPVAMSSQTADTALGLRYFGQVNLVMVPGRDADAPAATQFFFQDQIGLRVDGLKQHLRLPFTLRVFDTDAGRLIAEVQSEDAPNAAAPASVVSRPTVGAKPSNPDEFMRQTILSQKAADAGAAATPGAAAAAPRLARFWDTYVWYHQGGEQPGRYRAELYANGILTNSFDYTVGTEPIPAPQPTLEPTPKVAPVSEEVPPPAPQVVEKAKPAQSAPAPAPAAPLATAVPTAIPSPTPAPTPAKAGATTIGGLPAGLDVNPNDGRVFIADGSGVIWTTDPQRPSKLNRPINVDHLPVDLGIDQNTGFVFVSARNEPAVLVLDSNGQRLSTIPMPVAPGDLQVDSQLGLVFVVLPERQALGVIDGRAGRLLRTIPGLPQITSLALDPERHSLYATHLGGQLTVIDASSNQVTARMTLTGVGLASVATSRGLVYAVNTATHELAVVEPMSQGVIRYLLSAEPAAVAASEASGAVYVLASRPNTILRLDPSDGTEVGRVTLPDRSGRFGTVVDQADFHGLRARIVVNRADESLYVTLPEAGSLSIVGSDLFPGLVHDIPWVQTPDAAVYAATIPGVIRPGAPPLPDQPAPARAQAPTLTTEEAN
jgi:DNA-binding beta-propeller fold protein YncE